MRQPSYATLFSHLRRDVVYLNAASRSPLPARTLAVGLEAVKRKAATPWDIGDTSAATDDVRAFFADLLGGGATANDIAVLPCCSHAMSVAAHNMRGRLRRRPRGHRRVLVLADQNPSNVMPWQTLVEEEGGELLVVGFPDDGDWAAAVCAALADGSVAVAALPPCHWVDGSLVELPPIAAACRACDAALVLDATQWLGAGPPIDVERLGVAFLACSVHKWLLGPYGACLCYAAPAFWRHAQPLESHDRNREGAQHIECLPMSGSGSGAAGYPTPFQEGARRLDGGGRPSFIVMPMLRTSLTLIHELGAAAVAARLAQLTGEIRTKARALGFRVPARHAAGIIGLRPCAGMPSAAAIVEALAKRPRPVLVSERLGAIRVSPHLYNSVADVAELLDGLREAIAAGAGSARPASRL